ncbi:hypothetical protein VTJ83DRAFT_3545 [Remersonia thermophila]|uniref:Ubiquitin 3 binding protein But2 C-terminal domain-containing protein n=1 Tax=Remersonia thermophila TaxID=72144 RepID=A0ABR4DF83_9PEZI
MHLSILLTLATLSTLSSALPTPSLSSANRQPRHTSQTPACKHVYPPTAETPRLNVVNRPDLGHTTTQTVKFTLPPEASGSCTLEARFPPLWEVVDTSVDKGGPPLVVNVYAAGGSGRGPLVGAVALASPDPAENAPHPPPGREDRVVVVATGFECQQEVAFEFELAGQGEIGFVNGFDPGLKQSGGLAAVYGC